MRKDVFVVEVDRCIGCKACHVACKQGNSVPLGTDRNRNKQVGPVGTYPDVQMYFLQTMCQQCAYRRLPQEDRGRHHSHRQGYVHRLPLLRESLSL